MLACLRERIPAAELGRAGGISGWLRGLIYRELDLGEPPAYAAQVSAPRRGPEVPDECPLQAALEDAVRTLAAQPAAVAPPKVMKFTLWLRVENNSKFVRGKGKARAEIERYLERYDVVRQPSGDYTLFIPYASEDELPSVIDEIDREMAFLADLRHCFTEVDFYSPEDPDRFW